MGRFAMLLGRPGAEGWTIPEVCVGTVADFPTLQGTVVVVDGREVGVFNISGQFFAYENECLHQGGPACTGKILPKVEWVLGPDKTLLAQRFSSEELHFICPW